MNSARRRIERPVRERESPYKIIAVGFYEEQINTLDDAAVALQRAGYIKANRSGVLQMIVRRLQYDIRGMRPHEVLDFFFANYLRRPLAIAPAREIAEAAPRKGASSTKQHRRQGKGARTR